MEAIVHVLLELMKENLNFWIIHFQNIGLIYDQEYCSSSSKLINTFKSFESTTLGPMVLLKRVKISVYIGRFVCYIYVIIVFTFVCSSDDGSVIFRLWNRLQYYDNTTIPHKKMTIIVARINQYPGPKCYYSCPI